jgi:predicted PurR-regulated permease PerM
MSETVAWRVTTRAIMLIITLALLFALVAQLLELLIMLLLAIILAAAMSPIADRVADVARLRRWRWRPPRGLIVLLIYLTVALMLGLLLAAGLKLVVPELVDLVSQLPRLLGQVQSRLDSLVAQWPILGGLASAISVERIVALVRGAAGQIIQIISSLGGLVFNGFMVLLMALYLTVDGRAMRDYLLVFTPPSRREQNRRVTSAIGQRLGSWVRGQALLCLCIGVLTWIALVLIGLPYAALLAIIAGLLEVIPNLGPVLAAVPIVLVGLLDSPATALIALVACCLIQALENNLIVPRIMGGAVEIHPLVVVFVLLAGGSLLGITGAILSVPVAGALAVIVDEIRTALLERQDQQDEIPLAPRPAGLHDVA